MDVLFLKILNMSLSASWLILAIILLRMFLKKAPKWINCVLWALVAVRLLCPLSFESSMSLVPNPEPISPEIFMVEPSETHTNAAIDPVVNPNLPDAPSAVLDTTIDMMQTKSVYATLIWMSGVVAMLAYATISYIRVRRKVKASIRLQDRIWICDDIQMPFILGCFKPKIYIPSGTDEAQLPHIIAHENAHLKRRDHWWKPLGYLLLAIHWFNPLVWIAYILLCRDIELACDEKVIRNLNQSESVSYSEALLSCSVNRRTVMACPLAFGEVGVKERVKRVLNYKEPAFWIIVVALLSCIVVAVCFLTNPMGIQFENIVAENGYTITSQERYDFTLSIPKEKLPDTIYEPGGHQFKKDEVIVYQTDTTNVYLECVMPSNETEEQLYFIFNFSYKLPQSGKILVPHYKEDNGFLAGINLRNETLFTQAEQYTDAVRIRAQGPDEEFAFYVSTDACRAATGTLMIDVFCWEWTYYSDKEDGVRTPIKWFDYLPDPSGMIEDTKEISLPEYAGVTFHWNPESVQATTDSETIELYTGMPIWNVFFYDLTGDGKPELCSTVSYGSGMIDNRILIYDYANGASYELSDRGFYDFTLRSNKDGHLYVDKTKYNTDELIESGRLLFKDNCIQVEGFSNVARTILKAKLLEIDDGYFLVEPVEGSWELNSSDRIQVPMKNMNPSPEPEVGDILEIEYNGELLETYPAQLSEVYHIEVVQYVDDLKEYQKENILILRIIDGTETGNLVLAGEGANDVYTLNLTNGTTAIFLDGKEADASALEDGMPVEISYNGYIDETYPAQLGNEISISAYSLGTKNNPGGSFYDLCGLYLKVLDDLWEKDSGLNGGATIVSVDLSNAPGELTEGEKSAITWIFACSHQVNGLNLSFEELKEQGYLTKVETGGDSDKSPLYQWEDGVLLTIAADDWEDGEYYSLPVIKFDAGKWRSPLGAYHFTNCTAFCPEMGTWSDYSIGAEVIS